MDIGSSCSSLKKAGIYKSGYYNIKTETGIAIVFCDMESGNYDDVDQTLEAAINNSPLGTILPWVPKPQKNESLTAVDVPEGWQRCDGSVIPSPSVWAGQRTPDLNNEMRFLRGAPDGSVLTLEEDMIQDHQHEVEDPGHSHGYQDAHTRHDGYYVEAGSDRTYFWNPQDFSRTTNYTLSEISVKGVIDGSYGTETRPKNMHVTFIMKIF